MSSLWRGAKAGDNEFTRTHQMSTDAESPRENRSTLSALAVFVDRRTLVMLALGFKASALAQVLTAVGAPRAADAVRAAWASGAGVLVHLSLDLGFTLT